MEGITTVKVSDLTEIIRKLDVLESEIKRSRDIEEEAKAYTIGQAAKLLNLHYNSVRKLIVTGKLFAKYLNGDHGKTIIPLTAIRTFLSSVEDSNIKTIRHGK